MTSNIHKGSPLDFLLKRDMPPVALILAGYNKYRADGADNGGSAVMVYIYNNLVSDGSVDNS